ncbi:unnamed protein product [Phytophthora fragariaefolia]|uniref:Unnamed protein product n=1 Tax=Phytophthora fragariaefolia TaxID=1490495 RepID=A0A9W6Y271_9STRA|nr:unnamed protein product [Phytophthora fragariaefolia]
MPQPSLSFLTDRIPQAVQSTLPMNSEGTIDCGVNERKSLQGGCSNKAKFVPVSCMAEANLRSSAARSTRVILGYTLACSTCSSFVLLIKRETFIDHQPATQDWNLVTVADMASRKLPIGPILKKVQTTSCCLGVVASFELRPQPHSSRKTSCGPGFPTNYVQGVTFTAVPPCADDDEDQGHSQADDDNGHAVDSGSGRQDYSSEDDSEDGCEDECENSSVTETADDDQDPSMEDNSGE